MRVVRMLSAIGLVAVALAGCGSDSSDAPALRVDVIGTRSHDTGAFTQGFEIDGDRIIEGTGVSGRSFVRASDVHTGADLARVDLPAPLFGEGITVTDDRIWQITWRDGVAIERDATTLAEVRRVSYDGEGWGLCAFPDRLVMSDGSTTLAIRDRATFAQTGTVEVRGAGDAELNELECADDGSLYANVFQTGTILRIDPVAGVVTGRIDASGLLDRAEVSAADRDRADVLNGIAQIPGTDRFLITGKYWPLTFDVRFVQ